ncbi:MAG: ribose 5-phosphate isomerase A, partial [Alphaproteobacteria bacterium]|nr:ribose 5-phosphate isomerase A [Alphaproteobacteria bacterium]
DEISPNLDLIKGAGGALLREKIVASVSDRYVIIADETKLVPRLGAFALPVEVTPFALAAVTARLEAEGARPVLRRGAGGDAMVTDEGHHLLDCAYGAITDAPALARALTGIVGVVEHGLFVGMADVAVIGRDDGVEVIERAD